MAALARGLKTQTTLTFFHPKPTHYQGGSCLCTTAAVSLNKNVPPNPPAFLRNGWFVKQLNSFAFSGDSFSKQWSNSFNFPVVWKLVRTDPSSQGLLICLYEASLETPPHCVCMYFYIYKFYHHQLPISPLRKVGINQVLHELIGKCWRPECSNTLMSLGRPLMNAHWVFKSWFSTSPQSSMAKRTRSQPVQCPVSWLPATTLKLQCRSQLRSNRD